MNAMSEGPMAPQKSWWGRNWPWVVPMGCLGLLLSCGCLGALIAGFAFKGLSDTPAYTEAVARARQSPAVREALGEPLETSWNGQQMDVKTSGDEGSARLTIPLKGPRGSGLLRVLALKKEGTWRFQTLRVDVADREPIDLLDTPADEPSGSDEPPGLDEPPGARPDLPEDDAPGDREPEDAKELEL